MSKNITLRERSYELSRYFIFSDEREREREREG